MGELEQRWVQAEAVGARAQHARPAVDDRRVFVGGLGEPVYALARADGAPEWSVTRDGALSDCSPCHHDGRVYVGSGGGSVYALDASDGSEVWRHSTDSAIVSTPLVRDGTVYVGRINGTVLALDAANGSLLWSVELAEPVTADLGYAASEELVYVGTEVGTVHALDAGSAAEAWSHSFGSDVGVSAPVVANGRVYLAASELVGLRADTGQSTLATNFYGANAGAAPAVDDERVYLAGANGNVHGLDREGPLIRSRPAWTFETRETFVADPVVVGDVLVVASLEGTLYALDVESGAALDRVELPCETRSSPVADDGELYLGSRSGAVFGFECV